MECFLSPQPHGQLACEGKIHSTATSVTQDACLDDVPDARPSSEPLEPITNMYSLYSSSHSADRGFIASTAPQGPQSSTLGAPTTIVSGLQYCAAPVPAAPSGHEVEHNPSQCLLPGQSAPLPAAPFTEKVAHNPHVPVTGTSTAIGLTCTDGDTLVKGGSCRSFPEPPPTPRSADSSFRPRVKKISFSHEISFWFPSATQICLPKARDAPGSARIPASLSAQQAIWPLQHTRYLVTPLCLIWTQRVMFQAAVSRACWISLTCLCY